MAQGRKGTGSARNSFRPVPCVIAIDQSYTRTGLAICVRGQVKKATSVKLTNIKSKTMKRAAVQDMLNKAISSCLKHFDPSQVCVLVERIRTFTGIQESIETTAKGSNPFTGFRPDVLKAHASLIACIVDTAYYRGIKTYSVTTKSWKSSVLGTSKLVFDAVPGVKNPQKFGSVRKAISLGFEDKMKIKSFRTGNTSLDDDMADAICMSLYLFQKPPYQVKIEE